MSETKTPWLKNYGDVPLHLDYQECSMWEAVEKIAEKYPSNTAYIFMGKKTTYKEFAQSVEICARALKAIGIRVGDKITICMPNCPQTVIMFYAVNLVGAIARFIPFQAKRKLNSI